MRFPEIYGGLPLVTPLADPSRWLLATKSFCRNKKDPPLKIFGPLFFVKQEKLDFWQVFKVLTKKKTPVTGSKFSLQEDSLQKFELVDRTIDQIGNGVNSILDLAVLR